MNYWFIGLAYFSPILLLTKPSFCAIDKVSILCYDINITTKRTPTRYRPCRGFFLLIAKLIFGHGCKKSAR